MSKPMKKKVKRIRGVKVNGYKLRLIRHSRGLTGPQLAKLLHVSKASVSYWEVGGRNMGKHILNRVCDVLKIKEEDILL